MPGRNPNRPYSREEDPTFAHVQGKEGDIPIISSMSPQDLTQMPSNAELIARIRALKGGAQPPQAGMPGSAAGPMKVPGLTAYIQQNPMQVPGITAQVPSEKMAMDLALQQAVDEAMKQKPAQAVASVKKKGRAP